MILNLILGSLALLSFALTLWQWAVARRFPLHQRLAEHELPSAATPRPSPLAPLPSVTLLKPLKGCDASTEDCLRSWFTQQYSGPTQILFGVATDDDPVCGIVRRLLQEFPGADAHLVVGIQKRGSNAKVAKLAVLERLAKHELLVISDADVLAPPDLLANIVAPLCEAPRSTPGQSSANTPECGLVCCFYRLANPATLAMRWEAVAINADFWSQVLQSQSLKPLDFALGAVMATRRHCLQEIGGFAALVDCLADDYQLGNRIARRGHGIALSPVVVECRSAPMNWSAVWTHQLRWARTIRVCQPVPYFFSVLSNATLWPILWLIFRPGPAVLVGALVCCLLRVLTALDLQRRMMQEPNLGGRASPRAQASAENPAQPDARPQAAWPYAWLIPVKDLLQVALWLLSFLGNHIEWRGRRMRLRPDGTLEPARSGVHALPRV